MKNNNIFFNFIFLLVIVLIFATNKFLLLFLLPGLCVLYFRPFLTFSLFEKVAIVPFISLSIFIVGFWLLKYIPITITSYVNVLFIISTVFILIKGLPKLKNNPSFNKSLLLPTLTTLLITSIFLLVYKIKVLPAGADMATYTYLAKAIEINNSFPKSLEPLAPVNSFGEQSFGFSLISAVQSLLINSEIYRSALFTTSLSYIMLGVGLLLFLITLFSPLVSSITTLSVIFVTEEILEYIVWGGNPTIMAIAFILGGLTILTRSLIDNHLGFVSVVIISMMFFASFTVHHIPIVGFMYIYVPVVIYYAIIKKDAISKKLMFITFLTAFFAIPFLTTVNYPDEKTLGFVKDWQSNARWDFVWRGRLLNAIYTVPAFIENQFGTYTFALIAYGAVISLIKKKPFVMTFIFSTLMLCVLITNSHYWVLPLSPVLYPDRIVTLVLIPGSYFISVFLDNLVQAISKLKNIKTKSLASILFVLVLIYYFRVMGYPNLVRKIDTADLFTQVGSNDLKALNWIKINTPKESIFLNNYGDAGIWIPGIAERKVVTYDTGMENWLQLQNIDPKSADYVFIGEKAVYEGIVYKKHMFDDNPKYTVLFNEGGSVVYKINKRYE